MAMPGEQTKPWCGWCGDDMPAPTRDRPGRPPRFCSDDCRHKSFNFCKLEYHRRRKAGKAHKDQEHHA